MHESFKEKSIHGRYVTLEHINQNWFSKIAVEQIDQIGESVEGKKIPSITIGKGKTKILMWSQMHGNESTTTKAVLDLINFLYSNQNRAIAILENCELKVIPILNPDGAKSYTRVNANQVDLNRDAQEKSQPETRALWSVFKEFQPDFCFNLHDQRTLFNVGETNKVATVSFLSPASSSDRKLTPSRSIGMKLIAGMNQLLQETIPGQVGRYDDSFNANCIGDAFQMEQTPTILFEAGHAPKDYAREDTRKYIFLALVEALQMISDGTYQTHNVESYFAIPENNKRFFDVLVKNIDVVNPYMKPNLSAGIRYEEVLNEAKIDFMPKLTEVGELNNFFGHLELDCMDAKDFEELSFKKKILDLLIELQ